MSIQIYIHPKVLCEQKDCEEKMCPNRHLKHCKNYLKSSCKFGPSCEFKHDPKKKKRIEKSRSIEHCSQEVNTDFVVDDIVRELENSQNITNNENNTFEESLVEQLEQENNLKKDLKDNKITDSKDEIVRKVSDNDSLGIKEMFKEQNPRIKCDKCEHKAKNNSALKRHVKSYHEDKIQNVKELKSTQNNAPKAVKRKHDNETVLSRKKLNLN